MSTRRCSDGLLVNCNTILLVKLHNSMDNKDLCIFQQNFMTWFVTRKSTGRKSIDLAINEMLCLDITLTYERRESWQRVIWDARKYVTLPRMGPVPPQIQITFIWRVLAASTITEEHSYKSFGGPNDVERGRQHATFADVVHVEKTSSKLPFSIRIFLYTKKSMNAF